VFGLDVLRDAEEQVRMIIDNLRVAQSRQKSYAHTHRRELTFEVGDYVYLKVSPMRSVKRFNIAERTKATTIASAASSDRSRPRRVHVHPLSPPVLSDVQTEAHRTSFPLAGEILAIEHGAPLSEHCSQPPASFSLSPSLI
jgi:hypothetical protein